MLIVLFFCLINELNNELNNKFGVSDDLLNFILIQHYMKPWNI